jgi:hypothetical protein
MIESAKTSRRPGCLTAGLHRSLGRPVRPDPVDDLPKVGRLTLRDGASSASPKLWDDIIGK